MTSWRERLPVPRDQFIPAVVWVGDPAADGFTSVTREDGEPRWRALVEQDEPVVTRVDDGRTLPGDVGLRPSSSCSQPSLVATMLDRLDVHEGHRVLECASILADPREAEEACSIGRDALRLGRELRSARTVSYLRDFAIRLGRHQAVPAVAELSNELATTGISVDAGTGA